MFVKFHVKYDSYNRIQSIHVTNLQKWGISLLWTVSLFFAFVLSLQFSVYILLTEHD